MNFCLEGKIVFFLLIIGFKDLRRLLNYWDILVKNRFLKECTFRIFFVVGFFFYLWYEVKRIDNLNIIIN